LSSLNPNAVEIKGRVLGAGNPIAGSNIILYAAGIGTPKRLAEAKTDDKGEFKFRVDKLIYFSYRLENRYKNSN
jgi:hypothetical protein